MFCYNFMRTKNIMGFDKMYQAIQNWVPDYRKVTGFLKTVLIKGIYSPNQLPFFRRVSSVLIIKAAWLKPYGS